jgi:hypothetical protein
MLLIGFPFAKGARGKAYFATINKTIISFFAMTSQLHEAIIGVAE